MSDLEPISLNVVSNLEFPTTELNIGDSSSKSPSTGSFENLFKEMIGQTDKQVVGAESTIKELVAGSLEHPHQAMVKLEQAHLALQFTVQVRNKALEAYNEIMRMQI